MVRQKTTASHRATRSAEPTHRELMIRLNKRPINEGRSVASHQLLTYNTANTFANLQWSVFLDLPNSLYPKRVREFYASFTFDEEEDSVSFTVGGVEFNFTLTQFGSLLGIPTAGIRFYHDSHSLNHLPPAFTIAEVITTICNQNVPRTKTNLLGKDLLDDCAVWNKIIDSNIFPKSGHHSEISVTQAVLLHALKTNTEINIAYLIVNRMCGLPTSRRDLPYGRLLTRLFLNIPGLPSQVPTHASKPPIDLTTLRKMSSHAGRKRAHSSPQNTDEEIEQFHFGDEEEEDESAIQSDDGMVEGTLEERMVALNRNVNKLRKESRTMKSMLKAILKAVTCAHGGDGGDTAGPSHS